MNSQISKGQTYRNSCSERLGWETTASLKRAFACWMKKQCKDAIGTIKDLDFSIALTWTIQIIEKKYYGAKWLPANGYQHSSK